MNSIDLKCNNCGASLTKVEMQEDTYVCTHCGNKRIIREEKIINENNYVINQSITKNIFGKDNQDYAEFIAKAETFIRLQEYKSAIEILNKATNDNPANYTGWWLLTKAKLLFNINLETTNRALLKKFKMYKFESDYEKVLKTANKKELNEIQKEYIELLNNLNSYDNEKKYEKLSIKANYEKSNTFKSQIIGASLMLVIAIIVIAIVFFAQEFSPISIFFFLISLIIYSQAFEERKILNFINSKPKILISELMEYLKEEDKIIVIKKLKNMIDSGYLVEYELVDSEYLIKRTKE